MSDLPTWARVGTKVVFVDGANMVDGYPWERYPSVGEVYTIRSVDFNGLGLCSLRLVEIVNQPGDYREGVHEIAFFARRFRPLISQADDISAHFQQFLSTPLRRKSGKARELVSYASELKRTAR